MKRKQPFKREMEKKQKGLFFIGLMGALSFTLMAFEWTTFDADYLSQYNEPEALELEEIIEVTKIEPKKARIIPPTVKIEDLTKIEVIDDPTPDPEDKPDIDPKPTDIVDPSLKDLDNVIDLGDEDGPIIETGSEIIDLVKLSKIPAYPGGLEQMYKYLGKTIMYTECGKQNSIQGTVYVSFIVEKDGSIADVKIERGLDCGLNDVAVKSVKKMPNWSPGEVMGKPVRSRFMLPVKFVLRQ